MYKRIKPILLFLLVLVLWLPLLQGLFGIFRDKTHLKGVFVVPEKPEFVLDSFMTGNFQKRWDKYEDYNFGFRGLFVKMRNSFNYILFKELSVTDYFFGKNDFIFWRGYPEQTLGIQYNGKETNDATIEKIKFMKNELEKKGVHFLIVVAPSKEFIYPEYLPSEYNNKYKTPNNYTDFIEGYKKNNIPYIDFCPFFKNFKDTSQFPVFTKTGHHWSIYASSIARDSLLHFIEYHLNKPIPKYRNLGIELSDTARYSDADFEPPLNLFFSLNQPPYFYPKLEMVQSSKKNYHAKIIVIGDSFFEAIYQQSFLPQIFSESSRYWYYFQASNRLTGITCNTIGDENVLEELESSDFVILLGSIGTLSGFPYGVTDYYYQNFSNPRKGSFGQESYCFLKAANNKYVCADAARDNIVIADRDTPGSWETFSLLDLGNNKCTICSCANNFLSAELAHENEITATRKKFADWETFTMVKLENNIVAFKAANGKYLCVDEKSLQIFANGDKIGKNETFEMISK